jgi:hypothetical protein
MATAKRAVARGKGASVRRKSVRASNNAPHPQPPTSKPKGGPVAGTPSPMRTRLSPELQAHARRLFTETDRPGTEIAVDCGVDESVIRRMAKREGWVRFVAPPRDLPPVAKLLAEVEALERDRHPEERAQRASKGDGQPSSPPSFEGGLRPPPQDDGEGGERKDNIARISAVVMAHLDQFDALRKNGKLLPKQHLATARAISILIEAFNRLQLMRAASPGSITHDSYIDAPADLDAFRDELARRIRAFVAGRAGTRDGGGAAAVPADAAP